MCVRCLSPVSGEKTQKKQDASFHLCILQSHSPSQSSFNAQTHLSHNAIRLSPGHNGFISTYIAVSALKELRAKGTPSNAVLPGTGIAFDHRNRRFFSFRRWESDFGTFWNHTHLYVIGHETLVNMEQEKESDQTPLRLLTSKGYLIFHKFQVMDTTSSTPNPVAVDFLVYIHLFLLHPSQDERHSTRGKDATSLLEVNQPACLR